MGKSEGNMIKLSDNPRDIFGKVMAFDDSILPTGFEILTNYELTQVEEIKQRIQSGENPMTLKKLLAFEITRELKGEQEALNAKKYFEDIFQKKDIDTQLPVVEINSENINILDLIVKCKITDSKSQAKRLILQSAVSINTEKITDWTKQIQVGEYTVIRCGRHVYQLKYIPK